MFPNWVEPLDSLIAAMPEAHSRFGIDYCMERSITHLRKVETLEQLQAGEKAYTVMRHVADKLKIPLILSEKFPRKTDWGMTDRKGRIKVRKSLSPPHSAHIGIHELVHAYYQFSPLHPVGRRTQVQILEDEYEAELTAYLFSWYYKIDTVDSPYYIAAHHGKIRDITRVANRATAYAWQFICVGDIYYAP
jgi:hypothetical protein